MPRYSIIFESEETIRGVVPEAYDWVEYSSILKVRDGGKLPVSFDMAFIPPHPFAVNMPLKHSIRAESITAAYWKVTKFLAKYGVEFRGQS